jgi:hypothetical protein
MLALVDSLHSRTLNDARRKAVQVLHGDVPALVGRWQRRYYRARQIWYSVATLGGDIGGQYNRLADLFCSLCSRPQPI